jgi:hypothetical protein
VDLLVKAAKAVIILIKAIGDLIKTAWQRFQGEEFQAAKKRGHFVSSVKRTPRLVQWSRILCHVYEVRVS